MEPQQDFNSLQEGVQKSLVSVVRSVNRIAAEDLRFQRTVSSDAAELLDDRSRRCLDLSTRLLQSAARACGVKAPRLEDAEDVDMHWRAVVDVVDSVLEKADTAMDEYTGLVKRKEPPTSESSPKPKRPKSTARVVRNANIAKPQAHFERQPDNFATTPWRPMLTDKPHATLPLEQSFVAFTNDNGAPQFKHPYDIEITDMKYPDRVYESAEPIPYQPVETTKATWVDTYEGVLEMLKELKEAKEIAVDLEHHDFRTYTGLVCLMQISTREKDWIVDTLRPWRHKLEVLNEAFADPSIVKVFHGAYMDMVWLQRDLGLYVNGLFDTYFACDLLYSGRSLAFLLSKFVNFDADKQYQLADWRMRPIPEEMMYYARSDTHYLLYIYDRVRNDLIAASDRSKPETDYIGRALQKSKELSLSRHEHPDYDAATGEGSRGWYGYVFKHSHLAFNAEQFAVFKALWKWRDVTARKEDESPNFVLGTHHIAEIARVNPPDAKALHSLLPLTAPLARSRVAEVWKFIQEVKDQGGPSLLQFFASLSPDQAPKSFLRPPAREVAKLPELDGVAAAARLPRSQLFGDMPISTRWDESTHAPNGQGDYVPFPWQRFVQQASADAELRYEQFDEVPADETPVKQPAVEANAVEPDTRDEEFTLRRGTKRKSAAAEEEQAEEESDDDDGAASGSDAEMQDGPDGMIEIGDDEPTSRKDRNKKRQKVREGHSEDARLQRQNSKKARKAKQKENAAVARAEQQKKYEAVPFDYSKAASVMHADRTGAAEGPEAEARVEARAKKVFDPYAKTGDDALKGARKAPPVRGERSATFKK